MATILDSRFTNVTGRWWALKLVVLYAFVSVACAGGAGPESTEPVDDGAPRLQGQVP